MASWNSSKQHRMQENEHVSSATLCQAQSAIEVTPPSDQLCARPLANLLFALQTASKISASLFDDVPIFLLLAARQLLLQLPSLLLWQLSAARRKHQSSAPCCRCCADAVSVVAVAVALVVAGALAVACRCRQLLALRSAGALTMFSWRQFR
eukprot:3147261-Pleurochrysis_carterae.AAC.3